jgi:uncharacterized protein YndB with AHSA1/START domain
MSDPMLAVFLDRMTMQHERRYPHPIDRVWEAVTTSEHLDAWLLPVSSVEARLGGRCSFSWGGPAEASIEGTVTVFDPPHVVQYTFGHPDSYLRFELSEDGSATRLRFHQSFAPGEGSDTPDDAYEGADRPAGPDTPWRPGFVAGFHEMLDNLAGWLRSPWSADENPVVDPTAATSAGHSRWIEVYRPHIRDTCPDLSEGDGQ